MSWWRRLFRRARLEREVDAELRYHFDRLVDDHVRAGAPQGEARRLARLEFGGLQQTKESCRDRRRIPGVDSLVRDTRFAVRLMRRDPGFAVTAVAVLSLGIGVNNMFFTILHAHTLRGLPMHRAERVVAISLTDARTGTRGMAPGELETLRERARTLSGVAGFAAQPVVLAEDDRPPERFAGAVVTANAFGLIGVQPVLGRDLTPGDDRPGAPAVALLSESAWRARYGAPTGIDTLTVWIDGLPTSIAGVMPDRSGFPGTVDVWLPLSRYSGQAGSPPGLHLFARLRDGVSVADARAELESIAAALPSDATRPPQDVRMRVVPINEQYAGRLTEPAWLAFMAAGWLIVLISCANVAILLLGRSAGRSREVAIRSSLGASRGRVVQQLLVEGAALAGLGAIVGLGVSILAVRLFSSAIPEGVLPYWMEYSIEPGTLLALIGVSAATVFFFALAPALHASRVDVNRVLKAGGLFGSDRRTRRWTSAVLSGELALAVVLLAQLAVSIRAPAAPPPAERVISSSGILTAALTLPSEAYRAHDARNRFYRRLRDRLSAFAGTSASFASHLPLTGADRRRVRIGDETTPWDEAAATAVVGIGPSYFATLGLSLPRGREFADGDGGPGQAHAIVNERFVRQFLAGREPVGLHLRLQQPSPAEEPASLTIVGVAPDIRQRPQPDPEPVVYIPFRADSPATAFLVVRSSLDSSALVPLLRQELRSLDASLPLYQTRTMAQVVSDADWNGRVSRRLLVFLCFVAVALATGGLFTAAARTLAQRTPEIGLRMALGARRRHVMQMVLGATARQLAAGLAAGAAGAHLWSWIFHSGSAAVRATDPESLLIVAAVLGLAAVLASILPARRAIRLDPAAALRHE